VVDLKRARPAFRLDARPAGRNEDASTGRERSARARRFSISEVEWLPPLLAPEKILCIGINTPTAMPITRRRGAEISQHVHRAPSNRSPGINSRCAAVRSEQLDYEGEIALVISRAGRRIAPNRRSITSLRGRCGNEGTIRDWIRHGKFNVTQGKNWIRPAASALDRHTDEVDLTSRCISPSSSTAWSRKMTPPPA